MEALGQVGCPERPSFDSLSGKVGARPKLKDAARSLSQAVLGPQQGPLALFRLRAFNA